LCEQRFRKAPLFDAKNAARKQAPLKDFSSFIEPKSTKVACTPINRNQALSSVTSPLTLSIPQEVIAARKIVRMMTFLVVRNEFCISDCGSLNDSSNFEVEGVPDLELGDHESATLLYLHSGDDREGKTYLAAA
jgi:hypothetical protein